ncbi:hypothetical protein C7B65_01705 [Phormidesmis priestleyi ULC007]|uniref:Uncharacterized protein n=1 Tax=Phormidesmis priestleyi ULC007 TaxID=1920490 RepID=A0A2T1DNV7_9CYAN|nr:hypothetical protein [Phormidesmis priestleyi]PSB22145.1 hypothetical protein C7B65_01705 [Phormidesmis priestleyi ULC007]PZO52593.1 MAG: hypothetical protein DCF14_06490 [Phormidesmis priestleyi]
MDAEQAELLQTSPLIQRLDRRRTQPGVIDLSRYSTESTGLPKSIVQRSALVEQLQTRYSSRDSDSAGSTELALATASPAPRAERVFRSPEVTSVGAIAPSTPLAAKAPLTSEPLPLSAIAPVIATSPITEPDSATFTTAPETIAPFNESVSELAIVPTEPNHEYRIRRISANPTQPGAIQRKAASDSSATIASVSPVQSFSEAVSIATESPTRAKVDDPTSNSAIPALDFGTSTTAIAPISTFQSVEPTEATLVLRHMSDTSPAETIVSETIAQDSIPQNSIAPAQTSVEVPVVRPLVQAASLPTIVQRSPDPQSMVTGFNRQEPAAIASTLSISEPLLQPNLIGRSGFNAMTNGVLQRRIQPDLPLAISPIQGVQTTIARQTATNGSSTIALVPSSSEVPPPVPPPTSSNAINVGQIAEQVSRILFRQLTVERERRGMGKWS